MPSTFRPLPAWKSFTAVSVPEPRLPPIRSHDRLLSSTKSRCSRFTSGPVEPLCSVGPLFIEAPSPLYGRGRSNRFRPELVPQDQHIKPAVILVWESWAPMAFEELRNWASEPLISLDHVGWP